MHPILLSIGGITLYTYGLFVALGFLAAVWFSKKNARFYHINPDDISDIFLVVLVAAVAGARLLYVAINWPYYAKNPMEIYHIWSGGLVFFGGFIAAVSAALITARFKRLPVWKTADIIAPGIALGHCFGRIGCLFAGCCYGKACDLPFAVTFSHPESLAPQGIPLHPTQVYMAVSNLLLFLILIWLQQRRRFYGMVFLAYILLYSVFRFSVEFFRNDDRGYFLGTHLSMSQGISIVAALAALVWMIKLAGSANDNR